MPATPQIITQTFITGADKAQTLANMDYVRPFAWGNDWNRIRLGIHYTVTPDGTNNLTGCLFALGVCSGTSNPFNNTATNFVGYRNPQTGTGGFQYNTNSGNPYLNFSTNRGRFTCIQGGSEISSGGVNVAAGAGTCFSKPNNLSVPKRSAIFIEILKASPNYSYILWSQETTPLAAQDIFPWRFGQQMTQALGQVDSGLVGTSGTLSAAANESAGDLDCINVFWNKESFPWQIHCIAAVRYF